MNKLFAVIIFIFSAVLYLNGCSGDDPVTPPPASGNYHPDIALKTGNSYVYTNDSLTASGSHRTDVITNDVILPEVLIGGFNAFPVLTRNTGGGQNSVDTFYIRYDKTAGKFYQYGINQLLDTSQPPTWDLVANFSLARGTPWDIGNIEYTFEFGNFSFTMTGTLTGKIADSLTFQSTGTPPQTIQAYRIELHTLLNDPVNNVTADIYIDYYIGHSHSSYGANPSGLVRLKLRPFNIVHPLITYPVAGFDRILQSYSIAP